MKSPLRPNIRFNTLSELKKIIKPKSKISSLYLHDGEIELSLANLDFMVLSHTNKECIFEFWSDALQGPQELADWIQHYLSFIDEHQLAYLQNDWFKNRNKTIRNVLFYILHNSSDAGYSSCGNIDKKKVSPLLISKLRRFKINNFFPFYDRCEDPLDCLDSVGDVDYVLMPIGKYSFNFFEKGKSKGPEMYTFNHKNIHERTKHLNKKCILLYKSHPALFKLYNGFNIKMFDKYGRTTSNKEACEDLIITNF